MGNMLKTAFLEALQSGLAGLPQQDIEERLAFYGEMIDDRMEEGLSEEEAVAAIGPVDRVINEIVAQTPLTKIVKERIKPKRSLRAWEILLLILGFPLWFPLMIVAFVLILVFYIVLWVLVICLWAVELVLWAAALFGLVAAVLYMLHGYVAFGVVLLGAALTLIGLSILLFFGCKAASVGTAKLARSIVRGIKRLFVGKEKAR